MSDRVHLRAPALTLLCFALTASFAGWAGCGSGGSGQSVTGPGASSSGGSSTGTRAGSGGSGNGATVTSSSGHGAGGSSSSGPGAGGGAPGAGGGASDAGPDGSGCAADEKPCNGQCVKVDDPAYGCGPTSCAPCGAYPNGTAACSAGACALGACDSSFKNCDGDEGNGCEVNIQTDPMQCGACGAVCVVPNATPVCTNGACAVGTCNPGKTDCNGDPTDGCEADLQSDPQNCGQCNTPCPGQETCQLGECIVVCAPHTADCNNDPTDGCETSLGTSQDCAFCGDVCDPANAQGSCVDGGGGGGCTIVSCNAGFQDCDAVAANGCEVDTQTNANDCGSCGNECPSGPHSTAVCKTGACGIACDPGYTDCDNDPTDGCEADLSTSPSNCGACGVACQGMQACQQGVCSLDCANGTANCPGDPEDVCATTLGTNKNCNFCGDTCNLANATSQCQPSTSPPPAPPFVCALEACNAGFADCDQVAVNGCETRTQTDVNNCGSCGNVCPSGPHSTAVCTNGACGLVCVPGYTDCDRDPINGCEANVNTDTMNCGACGNACNTPDATPGCVGGQCTIVTCASGFADCDKQVADGCEANITTDPKNCGTCGSVCSEANGSAVCASGLCALGPCNAGFANCDGKYTTGCNVHTNTDPNNCGGCNDVCNLPNATPTCSGGQCQIASCNSGFQDCDHVASNGCETNTTTSPSNCGACGNACKAPNAVPTCQNGTCALGSCNPGFANCNGNAADGCEVNTLTDPNNCGGCGNRCNLPNATAFCNNGVCAVAACTSGFADCDGSPTNGCEVNTNSDPNNCGGCGDKCSLPHAGASCSGGLCTIVSCNVGYQNCDNVASNGCEININGDPNNCGGCGHVCNVPNGAAACSAGFCAVASCNTGYANCDGSVLNGCEVNTTDDNFNCGGCGTSCLIVCGGVAKHVSTTTCTASACAVATCAAGYQDADHLCSDGCESP